MSPAAQSHDQRPDYLCPSPLKINRDSHFIRKSSSSSSSSSSAASSIGIVGPQAKPQQQHRQPVIIYTHSPKVIHTHPKDFMALVQKLTGLSRNDDDQSSKSEILTSCPADENKSDKITGNDDAHHHDNESSSVITDENSSFLPPILDPRPGPFLANVPVFTPNSAHYINCSDPFLYMPPNMRTSISSSPAFSVINELQDY